MKQLGGENVEIVWSWDNPPIHGNVAQGTWDRRKNRNTPVHVTKDNHTMLPPYSPDMHKVIENSHSQVCRALQVFINEHTPTAEDTLQLYITELETLFYKEITPTWAKNTVKHLFAVTLPAILKADGGYPPSSAW